MSARRLRLPRSTEPSILERPHVAFGREICGDLEAGLRREWLVTNGLGGYASATLPGVLTRSYHGLLVAALEPPVARTVLVAGSVEWVDLRRRRAIRSRPTSSATARSRRTATATSNRFAWRERCRSGPSPSPTPWSSAGSGWRTARTRPSSPTACCGAVARSTWRSRRSSPIAASTRWPPGRAGTSASIRRSAGRRSAPTTGRRRSGCARTGPSSGPAAPGGGISGTARRPSAASPTTATSSRPASFVARLEPGETVALVYSTEAGARSRRRARPSPPPSSASDRCSTRAGVAGRGPGRPATRAGRRPVPRRPAAAGRPGRASR